MPPQSPLPPRAMHCTPSCSSRRWAGARAASWVNSSPRPRRRTCRSSSRLSARSSTSRRSRRRARRCTGPRSTSGATFRCSSQVVRAREAASTARLRAACRVREGVWPQRDACAGSDRPPHTWPPGTRSTHNTQHTVIFTRATSSCKQRTGSGAAVSPPPPVFRWRCVTL